MVPRWLVGRHSQSQLLELVSHVFMHFQVAFDLLALGAVAVNVLMTPRKSNGVIIRSLYRQGFYAFLVC